MRTAAILLTLGVLAAPAYAQSTDTQDHSAHHPTAEAAPAPSSDTSASPTASVRTEGAGQGATAGMGCQMMPEMMQSMMKGMMQGMSGGSGARGMAMGSGMAAGPGGARSAGPDQSLASITYRAIAQRAVAALQAAPSSGDTEFVRLAVALEEALTDAARAATAFSEDPETRRKAQQLATSRQDDLNALRAWSAQAK